MDERISSENDCKMEEIMLPGFRFHPTDEELVGFYLKRKVQQRPLSMELVKQLDIYKYDPWDLPKMATTGEKEWYFYCPRDRKYRNSARPNRVTGAGFWKATGTDRPIYSSEGTTKCIGLKKSLVFYKGRAAKGVKTDWMMHEFRLPSLLDSVPPKRFLDKTLPPNDSWAICRIFKKTSSTAQRALSHSWVSSIPTETSPSISDHMSNMNMPSLTEKASLNLNGAFPTNLDHHPNYNPSPQHSNSMSSNGDLTSLILPPLAHTTISASKSSVDVTSMLLNMSSSLLGDHHHYYKASESDSLHFGGGYSGTLLHHDHHQMQGNNNMIMISNDGDHENSLNVSHGEWDGGGSINGYPLGSPLPMNIIMGDAWKANQVQVGWDSSCPSDQMSTSFCSTKCYT